MPGMHLACCSQAGPHGGERKLNCANSRCFLYLQTSVRGMLQAGCAASSAQFVYAGVHSILVRPVAAAFLRGCDYYTSVSQFLQKNPKKEFATCTSNPIDTRGVL